MRTSIHARVLASAMFVLAASAASPGAFAQGTFTPGTGTPTNCNPSSSPIQQFSCTVGSASVTMTAWGYGGTNTSGSALGWRQGLIGDFDTNGIGIYTGTNETGTSSQHAFDNLTSGCGSTSVSGTSSLTSVCGGSIEALLLNFGSSTVSLTALNIGYFNTDADISVYRWTGGSGVPTALGTANTVSTSGSGSIAGWTLVSSKDVDNVANSWTGINSPYSSYFLITTYFGATSGSNGAQLDSGNDRFKLSSFTVACQNANCGTTTVTVPEPASLALASLGLVAALGVRRRSHRVSAPRLALS